MPLQVLKRSYNAVSKAGDLLNTTYGMPSSGEGDDLVLDLLAAAEISPQLNSFVGSDGEGFHVGEVKDFRVA